MCARHLIRSSPAGSDLTGLPVDGVQYESRAQLSVGDRAARNKDPGGCWRSKNHTRSPHNLHCPTRRHHPPHFPDFFSFFFSFLCLSFGETCSDCRDPKAWSSRSHRCNKARTGPVIETQCRPRRRWHHRHRSRPIRCISLRPRRRKSSRAITKARLMTGSTNTERESMPRPPWSHQPR